MCGRYTHRFKWKQLHRLMKLTTWPERELSPRYNVAPTQSAPVVRGGAGGGREGALLRWGLIPSWADDPSIGSRMINARAETAATKPSFRSAFKRRRCLVPASGFYEWQKIEGSKRKQPHLIGSRDGEILAFAGLWERWEPEQDEPVESFTILTTDANDLLRPLHHRMPVILPPRDWDRWLDPDGDGSDLKDLLRPCEPGLLEAYPVGTRVNSPANDDPSCLEPVEGQ